MMSLSIWLPGPMLLLGKGGSLCLVPCSFLGGGVSVQGGLCQGDPHQTETPPFSEERVVRILLECFLLLFDFAFCCCL